MCRREGAPCSTRGGCRRWAKAQAPWGVKPHRPPTLSEAGTPVWGQICTHMGCRQNPPKARASTCIGMMRTGLNLRVGGAVRGVGQRRWFHTVRHRAAYSPRPAAVAGRIRTRGTWSTFRLGGVWHHASTGKIGCARQSLHTRLRSPAPARHVAPGHVGPGQSRRATWGRRGLPHGVERSRDFFTCFYGVPRPTRYRLP